LAIGHPWFNRHRNDIHWQRLPESLKAEVEAHIDGLEDVDMGEPCIWHDAETGKCKHYEYRPQMCRDFEVGCFHCLRMRAEHGIS
jgi:Fe-S-cluster containining protein